MRRNRTAAAATGAAATGAKATGALAVGALALGALAIGALAIGRLSIGRARIRRLEIDELVVGAADAEAVVREYWRRMGSNAFDSVKTVLADDVLVHWPQSGERIRGPANVARMNAEYATAGAWTFRVNRLVAAGQVVVTQTSVTDGTQTAEPVSFFTVRDGRIAQIVEYWPEPFPAPEHRRHLTEPGPTGLEPTAGPEPTPPDGA